MERPPLDKNISAQDFKDFYWLKAELITFCRKAGISTAGGKIELSERISYFLSTGNFLATAEAPKPLATFDWNNENLTGSTLITDNYKNTENVRRFFAKEIGSSFSFNAKFMRWMKENTGKTLADAIQQWRFIYHSKKNNTGKTEIAAQFEYNRYMRAFITDNPTLTINDARKYWKLKSAQRGPNNYERSDLELT